MKNVPFDLCGEAHKDSVLIDNRHQKKIMANASAIQAGLS
jgi:hypothetical protein